jgi:hypothetical protein
MISACHRSRAILSLRAQRSNPEPQIKDWIASSLTLLAMTIAVAAQEFFAYLH